MMWVVAGAGNGVKSSAVCFVLDGRSYITFVLFLCWWKCTCRKQKVEYGRELTVAWERYVSLWEGTGFPIQVERMSLERPWVAHS